MTDEKKKITCCSCGAVISDDGGTLYERSPSLQKLEQIIAGLRDDLEKARADVRKAANSKREPPKRRKVEPAEPPKPEPPKGEPKSEPAGFLERLRGRVR